IEEVQTTLDRLFQHLVLGQVLDVLPHALVITDQGGNILSCNATARDMFERASVSLEDNLASFLGGPLSAMGPSSIMTTVIGAAGTRKSVMVSTFTLREEYDHLVFVLQDVTELQWRTDRQQLKTALAETAAQVRVPVSLLSNFVHQIG